jgi:hypothetical protein
MAPHGGQRASAAQAPGPHVAEVVQASDTTQPPTPSSPAPAPAAPAPLALAGTAPTAAPEPPAAKAETPAAPAAPADGRSLVIAGSGEVIIEIEVGARDLADLATRGIPGLRVSSASTLDAPTAGPRDPQETAYEQQRSRVLQLLRTPAAPALRLEVTGAPVRLAVPPDCVKRIHHEGSGTVRLRGLRGDRLSLTRTGSGTLVATDLALTRLDLSTTGSGITTLSGRADEFAVAIGGTAPGGSSTIIVNGTVIVDGSVLARGAGSGGAVDARGLAAQTIDATLSGSGTLKLGGHAQTLRLSVSGSGTVDAPGLAVDRADVAITGSGNATLGELQQLSASCTGGGDLRYSGNPRLGRIVTGR